MDQVNAREERKTEEKINSRGEMMGGGTDD
jgi:hypothetical protein